MDNTKIHLLKKCPQCENDYSVRSSSELETRRYCSKLCQLNASKKSKVGVLCEVCGESVSVYPCLASTTRYCSRKCKGLAKRSVDEFGMKKCTKCNKRLRIENFYSVAQSRCKDCEKQRARAANRTTGGRYIFAKSLAKKRKLEWAILLIDYEKLIDEACHYCGRLIDPTGVGLDRKDNNKGYSLENVVPSCGLCNTTRSDRFTYEEMLILAIAVKKILDNREISAALPHDGV